MAVAAHPYAITAALPVNSICLSAAMGGLLMIVSLCEGRLYLEAHRQSVSEREEAV